MFFSGKKVVPVAVVFDSIHSVVRYETPCAQQDKLQMATSIETAKAHSHACPRGLGTRLLFRRIPCSSTSDSLLILAMHNCRYISLCHLAFQQWFQLPRFAVGDSAANSHSQTDSSLTLTSQSLPKGDSAVNNINN